MNEENRKQIILLVLLVVGAGFFVFRALSTPIGSPSAATSTRTTSTGLSGAAGIVEFKSVFEDEDIDIDKLIQNIQGVEFQYADEQIARDPSVPVLNGDPSQTINPPWPPSGPTLKPDSLLYLAQLKTVTGIIFDTEKPMAVISHPDKDKPSDVVYVGYEFRETPDAAPIVVKSIAIDFVVFSIPSEDEEITKYLVKEQ